MKVSGPLGDNFIEGRLLQLVIGGGFLKNWMHKKGIC
jgi:hypothetical protein